MCKRKQYILCTKWWNLFNIGDSRRLDVKSWYVEKMNNGVCF